MLHEAEAAIKATLHQFNDIVHGCLAAAGYTLVERPNAETTKWSIAKHGATKIAPDSAALADCANSVALKILDALRDKRPSGPIWLTSSTTTDSDCDARTFMSRVFA